MEAPSDFRRFLFEQIEERRRRVPSYSLRSFSAKIGVSPASLSQIISGKRGLTKKMALKIAERLCLGPQETRTLVQSALNEKVRTLFSDSPVSCATREAAVELNLDSFRLISDWYHYAILNLLEVKGVKTNPEWFARRLDITVLEAHQALLRLTRLGFIAREGQKLKRTTKHLKTPVNISDAAIRKYHYQNLRKAEEALDREKVEIRDFGAITLAIDPEMVPKAKFLAKQFRQQMAELMHTGKKERVYTFVTQLFPVDRNL